MNEFRKGTDLRNKEGIYTWDGKQYPSVTSVVDALDGSDMIFVHSSYIQREVAGLVALAEAKMPAVRWEKVVCPVFGTEEWNQVECSAKEALKDARTIEYAGWRQLRKDADRGSVIHELISQWVDGSGMIQDDLPGWVEMTICEDKRSCHVDDVLPYAKSALHWLDTHNPKCIHVDSPVFHDGRKGECEDGWGLYAGTLDFIGYLGGRLFLIDFKTSKASRRAHGMQLAAYRHARWIGMKGTGERRPMVRVEDVMSVLIQPDRVTPRTWSSTQDWFKAFRHALHAMHRLRGNMNVTTLHGYVTKTDTADKGRLSVPA